MIKLKLDCIWLPASHGGRPTAPHPGLRLGIRWQRYIQDAMGCYRDLQLQEVSFEDSGARQGVAIGNLEMEIPETWKNPGELVELLEGYQVVAIGRVLDANDG